MNYWLIDNITVFLLCMIFSGLFIPIILLKAFGLRFIDKPDNKYFIDADTALVGLSIASGRTGFSRFVRM